jgi:hypothetical protein
VVVVFVAGPGLEFELDAGLGAGVAAGLEEVLASALGLGVALVAVDADFRLSFL